MIKSKDYFFKDWSFEENFSAEVVVVSGEECAKRVIGIFFDVLA